MRRLSTCTLAIGPLRVALVPGEECTAAPVVEQRPGAWRPRGEPTAFELIGSFHDEQENERLRRELHATTDYLILERYPGPGELEDYLIAIGLVQTPRCRGREPLSEVLRQHDRVVASSLDTELDGEALAARALTELAAKSEIDSLSFEQVCTDDGVLVRAFARGLRWELALPDERCVPIMDLVAFLNTIGRQLGIDRCFVELDRANHVTWGRWSAISRAARDGLFGAQLKQHWCCRVFDGMHARDTEREDELDLAYLERDVVPPPRVRESLLEMVAASDRITRSELVARITSTIAKVLGRRYPGVQFDATYEASTGLFEPLALVDAEASDVEWMRERGAEAEIGDELAYRLIPNDIEQAAERWPDLDLETVVSCCEHALGWVLADCFAPDWLGRLPILLAA